MLDSINWQPYRIGARLRLRPLRSDDFDDLFLAASDPLIWELHPDSKRHTRERFEVYFRSGLESQGALVVIDLKTGRIIGSSRFSAYSPGNSLGNSLGNSSVDIGYTFLTREYWGGGTNRELKTLMLTYAFEFVESVNFVVGIDNLRSRRAMVNIGGKLITEKMSSGVASVVFEIKKADWLNSKTPTPVFDQSQLYTARLALEPIVESHATELCELLSEPSLHAFVPYEPISLEKQKERCQKWSKRCSTDGTELWLNWAARKIDTQQVIAHFQAGVKEDRIATIGYVVARNYHRQGIATEGLQAVFKYLREALAVREVKAWSDTRNQASHALARKLGMKKVDLIKNADYFKGTHSDEFVFSLVLKDPSEQSPLPVTSLNFP